MRGSLEISHVRPARELRHSGKAYLEGAALADPAGNVEGAAMRLGDGTGDTQAQAGTLRAVVAGGIGSVEALEDVFLLSLRETDSRVPHGQADRIVQLS